VLNIIVPVFDLGRSFGIVKPRKSLEKVLKNSGNFYSKLCRNSGLSTWLAADMLREFCLQHVMYVDQQLFTSLFVTCFVSREPTLRGKPQRWARTIWTENLF